MVPVIVRLITKELVALYHEFELECSSGGHELANLVIVTDEDAHHNSIELFVIP